MSGVGRGIPASQLARDYGVSLNEFSDSVISLIGQSWPTEREALSGAHRHEICAALSAAMISAFDSSTLVPEEREKIQPLITDVLLPFWNQHCASDQPELVKSITGRAEHYHALRVPDSQVETAVNLVSALLDALETPAAGRRELEERLVPAFAHRMVGDTFRMDDLRRKRGIEFRE